MEHSITVKVGMFCSSEDRPYSQKCLLYLLEGLVNCNREYLRSHSTPLLYDSGCRYIRESNTEEWLGIPEILKAKGGDCEDLACWRVAELREAGISARPFIRWRRFKGNEVRGIPDLWLYHVLVAYPDNRMEDPSARLGMRGEG